MKRTFFIVLLAIFFTFDIFFAISTAVAENIKSSSDIEMVRPSEKSDVVFTDINRQHNQSGSELLMHN
ncbi:MAG: hypothetical protein KI793_02455 [Rivularia sp. (in: Bacteria)]|nr:hypothetical protein [Rivularia sp. MS3]